MVQVRYIVTDVDTAITFYCKLLNFHLDMHPAPAFAMISLGDLQLIPSAPNPEGGGQPMPDGTSQKPGGLNRFAIEVTDLKAIAESLRQDNVHFHSEIITDVGAKQIILDNSSGNPIELFEPIIPEARLAK